MFKYARVKWATKPINYYHQKNNNAVNKYNNYDILQLHTFLGGWQNKEQERKDNTEEMLLPREHVRSLAPNILNFGGNFWHPRYFT